MTGRLLSYFPDEEVLAQRGGVICPSWNSQMMKELRRAPQFADIFWRAISSPSTPYPCFFSSTSLPCLHYSFPWDAVTNDYNLSGLRQHTLIHLQFWRPEVGSQYLWLKSRCWQDHTPSETGWGPSRLSPTGFSQRILLCLFQLLGMVGSPWSSLVCRHITPISTSIICGLLLVGSISKSPLLIRATIILD